MLARDGRDGSEEIYAGYRLGLLLAASGRTDAALAAFEGVPCEPPPGADSATAYFARAALLRRGDILYASGRPEAAVPVYERVVSLWANTGDAAWALFQIGNVERRAGRVDEALERYHAVLERWPDGRWAGMATWGVEECERILSAARAAQDATSAARGARPPEAKGGT